MPLPLERIVERLRAAGCVYAEDEARLLASACAPHASDALEALVQRRIAGHPIEHVLGWAEFCGLRIVVDAGVFVPRRRTEFLAEQAVARTAPGALVLDLCCGTAAVGVVLAHRIEAIRLHAADLDPAAVRCARRNVAPWHGAVHEGDLYDALPPALRGRVDVLVVNAPYVPSEAIETLPREARLHEPRLSLDGGIDGHRIQQRVAAGAAAWLAPNGRLLMETGEPLADRTAALFREAGLSAQILHCAERDAAVVIGERVARR